MLFKMRVLHFSPKGLTESIATAVSRGQKCATDKIPPAYPVETEKLLFIGVELKGASVDKTVEAFCKDLSPQRVKNVAFFATSGGDFSAINGLKKMVSANGCNVIDEVFECTVKGGLFKKGNVSDEDLKKSSAWADKIVQSLVD